MAREFDWSLLTVPDAMAMVRGQLGFSWAQLSPRLETLSDDEFTWRPAPGALSVVRREEVATGARGVGAGEYVVEWPPEATDAALGPPGAGTRTIAWLVAHLTEVFAERSDWTFGEHRLDRDDLTYHRDRAPAVSQLVHWVDTWQAGVDAMDPARVYEVGVSTATEVDASAPFGHLVLHLNRELVHHGAEICTLQDLHRAGRAT
jgi:hypothetical protein